MLNGWVVETRVHFGDDLCHYVGVSVFFRKVSVTFLGRTPVLIVFVGVGSLLAYRLGLRLLQSHVIGVDSDGGPLQEDHNVPTTSKGCGLVCCKCRDESTASSDGQPRSEVRDEDTASVDTELTDIIYQSSPCHVTGSRIRASLRHRETVARDTGHGNSHPLYDHDSPYLLSLDQLNSLKSPGRPSRSSAGSGRSTSPFRSRGHPSGRQLFNEPPDNLEQNDCEIRGDDERILIVSYDEHDTPRDEDCEADETGAPTWFAMDSPPPIRRKVGPKSQLNMTSGSGCSSKMGRERSNDEVAGEHSEGSSLFGDSPASFQWDQICTPEHELGGQFDVPEDCINPVAFLLESIRTKNNPTSPSPERPTRDSSEHKDPAAFHFPTSAIFSRVYHHGREGCSCSNNGCAGSSDGSSSDSNIDPSVIRHRFSSHVNVGHHHDGRHHAGDVSSATRGLLDLLGDLPELDENAVVDDSGDEYIDESNGHDFGVHGNWKKRTGGSDFAHAPGGDSSLFYGGQAAADEEDTGSSIMAAIDADMNLGDSTQHQIDVIFGDIDVLKSEVRDFHSDVAMRTSQVFASDMTKLYCSVPPMAPSTVYGGLDDRSSIVSGGQQDDTGSEYSAAGGDRSCRSSSDRFWNTVRRRNSWRRPKPMSSASFNRMSSSMVDDPAGSISQLGSSPPIASSRRAHSCSCSNLNASVGGGDVGNHATAQHFASLSLPPNRPVCRNVMESSVTSETAGGAGKRPGSSVCQQRNHRSASPFVQSAVGTQCNSSTCPNHIANNFNTSHNNYINNNNNNKGTNLVGSASCSSLNLPSTGAAPHVESSSSSNGGERADYFADSLHNISFSERLLAGRRPPLQLPLGATGSYSNALNDSYHTQISLDLAASQRSDESISAGGRRLFCASQDVTPLSGSSNNNQSTGGCLNSSGAMQRSFLTDSFISTDYTPSDGNFDPSTHDNYSFRPAPPPTATGCAGDLFPLTSVTCAMTAENLGEECLPEPDSVPIWSSTPASNHPQSSNILTDYFSALDRNRSTDKWNCTADFSPNLAARVMASPARNSALLDTRGSRSQSCAGETSSDAWQWDDFVVAEGENGNSTFDRVDEDNCVALPPHYLQRELDAVMPETLQSAQWLSQQDQEQCLEAVRVADWAAQRFPGNKRVSRILRILDVRHGYSLVVLPPTSRVVDPFAANFIQPNFELVAGRPFSVLKSVVLAAVAQSVPVFRCKSFGIVQEALEFSTKTKRHGYLTAWQFPGELVNRGVSGHQAQSRSRSPDDIILLMTKCLQRFWQLTSPNEPESGSFSSSAFIEFYHGHTALEPQVLEGAKLLMMLRAVDVFEHIRSSREVPLAFYHALFMRYRLPELMAELARWERTVARDQETNELLIALLADTLGVRIDCFPFHSVKPANHSASVRNATDSTSTSSVSEPLIAVVYPQKAGATTHQHTVLNDSAPCEPTPRIVLLQTGLADYLPLLKSDQQVDSSV